MQHQSATTSHTLVLPSRRLHLEDSAPARLTGLAQAHVVSSRCQRHKDVVGTGFKANLARHRPLSGGKKLV